MIALVTLGLFGLILMVTGFGLLSEGKAYRNMAFSLAATGALMILAGIGSYPYAKVWQSRLAGEASLAEAEADRQIKVREAEATRDAAKMLAEAEVLRAKGVAEANRIVADGLGGPEGYLRYLYIDGLKEARAAGAQIIYVPTEAGLPILEAGRR